MKTIDIPTRNIFRFNFGTSDKPEYGHMRYVFDDEGNELGMFNTLTCDGKVDTSTAGRVWGEEMKSKLV